MHHPWGANISTAPAPVPPARRARRRWPQESKMETKANYS